jgi:hypothetical protein
MKTRVSTSLLIAIATILFFLVCAAIAQEPKPRREAKIFSCPAPSAPDASEWKCERILIRAAKILKKNPDATLVMVGGDDSDGEYLTSLGIDPKRITEKPSSGRLVLIVRFAPKPIWNEKTKAWSCPAGYDVYASEAQAVASKSFVHCVK